MIADYAWYPKARCRSKGLPRGGRLQRIEMVPDDPAGREVLVAKGQCFICPVRAECFRTALAEPGLVGVWGGFSEVERARLRAGLRPAECTGCGYWFVGPPDEPLCDSCAALFIRGALYSRVRAREQQVRNLLVNIRQKASRVAVQLGLDARALDAWCQDHLTAKQYAWTVAPTLAERKGPKPALMPCGTEAARTRHRRELRKQGKPPMLHHLTCACRTQPQIAGWAEVVVEGPDGTPTTAYTRTRRGKPQKIQTRAGKARQGMAA